MNRRDRELMNRMYICAAKAGSLYPANPANIKLVVQAAQKATQAARDLGFALSNLSYGDFEEAVEDVEALEEFLGIERKATSRTPPRKELS